MNGDVAQAVVRTKRIAFTKRQLEEIEKFESDRKAGKIDFVFEGTFLEAHAFLKGAKKIVDCFNL